MREVDGERVRMIREATVVHSEIEDEIVRRDNAPVPVVK